VVEQLLEPLRRSHQNILADATMQAFAAIGFPGQTLRDLFAMSCLSLACACRHLRAGRIIIVILAVIGILPLLASPTALNATTVSGTLIMGLGPPVWFLIFVKGYRPLTFHLPFWW